MVYRLCVVLLLAGMFSVATAENQKGKASGAISISNAPVQEGSTISSSSSAAYTLLYQGVISNSDGSSVTDGVHSLTFRVYDGPDGGVDLWTEVIQVTTQNGYFSAILGLTNPLNLPRDKDLYMGIQVEGDASEMTPRQQIAASNSADSNSPGNPPIILDVHDEDWEEEDAGRWPFVLFTRDDWGLSRGRPDAEHPNQLFGDTQNHVNLGREGVTGTDGQNYTNCTIGGGQLNQATADMTTVAGGLENMATEKNAIVGGGVHNISSGPSSAIIGGQDNVASGEVSTVGGGNENNASGDGSIIGGGILNVAGDKNSVVGGGAQNYAKGLESSIIGGNSNLAGGSYSMAAGGRADTVNAVYGGAAAGYTNKVGDATSDTGAFVGGGVNNIINNKYGSIGGGRGNQTYADYASISGGYLNVVDGAFGSVAGGKENYARGEYSFVAGQNNSAEGLANAVGGGSANISRGDYSTIPGGYGNDAAGEYSFAAGKTASALYDGCFVWKDASEGYFTASAPNQFLIKAEGGVGIGTNSPSNPLTVGGNADITGHLGIGTTTPIQALDVNGVIRNQTGMFFSPGSGTDFKFFHERQGEDPAAQVIKAGGMAITGDMYNHTPPLAGLFVEGNVGIGATSPQTKLEVSGSIRSTYPDNPSLYTDVYYHQTQGPTIEGHGFSKLSLAPDGATAMTLQSDGKVGIGTTSPGKTLDIEGNMRLSYGGLYSDNAFKLFTYSPEGAAQTLKAGALAITDNYTNNPPANGLYVQGNVGIGTSSPTAKVDINGTAKMTGFALPTGAQSGYLLTSDAQGNGSWQAAPSGSQWLDGSGGAIYYNNGNVGVGTSAPSAKLDVKGQMIVGGSSQVGMITLKDGSNNTIAQIGQGLDYAESFPTSYDKLDPGTVMSIDPSNAGKLKICESAFDRKVAGIVAGANGLNSGVKLGIAGIEGDQPLALAGRVYCKVDGSFGAIEPGDLLTTSTNPGYAMVVRDHTKAQGAIIGKAMEAMPQGQTGLILVLVSLQ